MNRKFLSLAALMAVIVLGSTYAVRAEEDSPKVKAPTAEATNKVCPISGEANGEDSVTVEYRGRTVTLCCKMCRGDWKKMTDAERDAKLAKVATGKGASTSKAAGKTESYPFATCPVSGKSLDAMGGAVIKQYDGREVRFCCKGCVGKFEKDRAKFDAKIDKMVVDDQAARYPLMTCPVSGQKLGAMGDPVDQVIDYRLFRLCCNGCKKKLAADPDTYRAKLDAAVVSAQSATYPLKTCVVSGKALGAMGEAPEIVAAGRLVRFCCKGCIGKFKKAPAGYIAKLDEAAKATSKKTDDK